ncbi:MAG TPA: T9SS type A sorting domain-containing protein [Saprospiraceae bacterium]|nr:T9SS type A sorting domain-containing protein [Saprospiraceae bacterium]
MKKCLLMLSGIVMTAGMLFAQPPANDKCEGAVALTIYNSEAEAIPVDGDTRNTTDAAQDSIPVCSQNFYRDDVWYCVTGPAEVNESGYVVKVYFADLATDIDSFGIAVYASCDAIGTIFCGNIPEDDQVVVCLGPGEKVYIRVWSAFGGAGDWQAGWGTFRITAYNAEFVGSTNVTVLWGDQPGEGDFADGFNAWTTEGIECNGTGPENAVWEWTSSGFPFYIFGPYGGISPIKSRTVCNGSVIFDSGFKHFGETGVGGSGPCPWDSHEGALISPVIDLSAFTVAGISVLFNQSMQRFSGGQHFLDYSTDGGQTWTIIEINADKDYLSTNPETGEGYFNEELRVRLPGVSGEANLARGPDNLRIRFRFSGAAYWWVIDDVRIIETEANNLRLDQAFVTYQLPIQGVRNQGIPWMPQVDFMNVGAVTQTNVTLNAQVWDPMGNTIYNESVNFGVLEADSALVNENSTINVPFDIAALDTGTYTITYTLTSDSANLANDFNPLDNVITYEAFVDGDIFSTEHGPNGQVVGAAANWNDGVAHSFIFGNYYHTPVGSVREFLSATFGLANLDELQGVPIDFVLFKWNSGLEDELCQATEREIIAFATYIPEAGDGGTDGDSILTLEFERLVGMGPIILEDNTSYIVAILWNSPGDNGDLVVLVSDVVDYGQTIQQLGTFGTPHFAGMLAVPNDGMNDGVDIGTTTYNNAPKSARSIVPVARMNTDLLIAVKDPLPVNNIVKLYPNPAQDVVTLDLELERSFDRVDVQIVSLDGKVLSERTLYNVEKETTTLDVSRLPGGTYLAHVETEVGRRYLVFVVQR